MYQTQDEVFTNEQGGQVRTVSVPTSCPPVQEDEDRLNSLPGVLLAILHLSVCGQNKSGPVTVRAKHIRQSKRKREIHRSHSSCKAVSVTPLTWICQCASREAALASLNAKNAVDSQGLAQPV